MIDVGHFWGFQADEASLGKQRRLTAEINQRTLLPVSVSLYPNLLCLAPYSEDKEQSLSYYRAKVLHLRNNSVEVNTRSHTHHNLQDAVGSFNSFGTDVFLLPHSLRFPDSFFAK